MAKKIFEKGWTAIPNHIINNNQLSAKAKCLWVYINSKPDEWDFSISGTCAQMKEGREAIRKACQELESWGLLTRQQNNEKGVFGCSEWILSDVPYEVLTVARKPDDGKPDIGKSTTSNKDLSNNKKEIKTKAKFELPYFIKEDVWKDFEEMRKSIKKPLTDRARQIIVGKLKGFGEHSANESLLQSIEHNWQTVYELKEQQPQQTSGYQSSQLL